MILVLGMLGDPGKIPRIGHEKPKLWCPAAYRLLWSMLDRPLVWPSHPQALPPPYPHGCIFEKKAQLCSWLSFTQKSSLGPCCPPKETKVLWLLRPSVIPSCGSVWPLLCETPFLLKCLDPCQPGVPSANCQGLLFATSSMVLFSLDHQLYLNQIRSLHLWYSHRRGSFVALHKIFSICALAPNIQHPTNTCTNTRSFTLWG